MNRRQHKRKHARRLQHAQARTPDRPELTISGAGCPKVDKGHIVPRMYQRAWEGERCLVAVHEPGSSAFELKSTKLAGLRGPYYRRTRPRHGTETDDIDASLGYVENKAAPGRHTLLSLVHEHMPLAFALLGLAPGGFGSPLCRDAPLLGEATRLDNPFGDLPEQVRQAFFERHEWRSDQRD